MLRDVRSELQTILGDATLERELWGGGMSRVFVSRENALDRPVVVKVVPPELPASISTERFRREIVVAAMLHHPHIVPLLSASASGDLLFYTMPLVPGGSLKHRLQAARPLPSSAALQIAGEVAAAVASAHRQVVLKAFLDGERQLRHANWDSARVAYERAIAADTTLAMGYSRLSLMVGWRRIAGDSLARAYALRAGSLSRGLGPHDSLFVIADSPSASVDDPETQERRWPRAERLLKTRQLATERYPDEPIGWYELGEARMHHGGPLGVTEAETRAAFDHAIALDSAFSPAYAHQIELALEMGGDTPHGRT